jgi:sarcosine oxidase, subunit beta
MLHSFKPFSRPLPLLSGWARFASKAAFDVIVVGGGSVGPSIAYTLAENRISTALVESNHGTGLGQNRAAIGGVRGTHSSAAKISVSLRSLEVLRSWQKDFGDDIEYHEGGYYFPLFDEPSKKIMTGLLPYQKSWGLNIDFIDPQASKKLIPGISEENLLGGIYSPEDANVSPLLTSVAISRRLQRSGVKTYFGKRATRLLVSHGNSKMTEGVELDDGTILKSDVIIDGMPYDSCITCIWTLLAYVLFS